MALDPFKNHMLLRASAGTGKTYQLVEAYVDLVQKDKLRPSQIIAITFTKKAAAELRSRIRNRLTHEKVDPQIIQDLNRSPIGTFHSLAMQWLQQYGAKIGISTAIKTLEQSGSDEQLFIDACHSSWFSEPNILSENVSRVARYFELSSELPKSLWHCIALAREDNKSIDTNLITEKNTPYSAWQSLHNTIKSQRDKILSTVATMELTEKRSKQYEILRTIIPPDIISKSDYESLELSALIPKIEDWSNDWIRSIQLFSDFNSRKKGVENIFPVADRDQLKQDVKSFREEVLLERLSPDLATLMISAYTNYTEQKQASGVYDFVDLIYLFNKCLDDYDTHQEIRKRIKAVLVDEAQDTNILQRNMIDKLVGLSGPTASIIPPAHLFVVGDAKQSIYTFRGADPSSFRDFAKTILSLSGNTSTLETSYRSTPPLIESINQIGNLLFGKSDYDALRAPDPYPTTKYPNPAVTWLKTGEKSSIEQEAHSTARWLSMRLAQGEPPGNIVILMRSMKHAHIFSKALQNACIPVCLLGGNDFYEQSEIYDHLALLTWILYPQETLAACAALRSPIFGISDTILWLLQNHPDPSHAGLGALRSGLWDPEIFTHVLSKIEDINQDQINILIRISKLIPICVSETHTKAADEILTLLDEMFDIQATYLGLEYGAQKLANIEKLWILAKEHAQEYGPDIGHFVWMQTYRQNSKVREPFENIPASERNAVGIGSIHQSKGLQYPIVVLPYLNGAPKSSSSKVRYERNMGLLFQSEISAKAKSGTRAWIHAKQQDKEREAQEKRRLFYVAITRAERELVFVCQDTFKPRDQSFAQFFLTWQQDPKSASFIHIAESTPDTSVPALPERTFRTNAVIHTNNRKLPPSTHLHINVTTLVSDHSSFKMDIQKNHIEDSQKYISDKLFNSVSPTEQGLLMHALLSRVEDIGAANSIDSFVDQALQQFGYSPKDKSIEQLRNDANAFLKSPLGTHIIALSKSDRRHEMAFQVSSDRFSYPITLHGQLDLIFEENNTFVIVDYKYTNPSENSKIYQKQLNAYAWAISKLCKHSAPIRCLLVYLRGGKHQPIEHWASTLEYQEVEHLLQNYVMHRSNRPYTDQHDLLDSIKGQYDVES